MQISTGELQLLPQSQLESQRLSQIYEFINASNSVNEAGTHCIRQNNRQTPQIHDTINKKSAKTC